MMRSEIARDAVGMREGWRCGAAPTRARKRARIVHVLDGCALPLEGSLGAGASSSYGAVQTKGRTWG